MAVWTATALAAMKETIEKTVRKAVTDSFDWWFGEREAHDLRADKIYTTKGLAAVLGKDYNWVYKMATQGEIPCVFLGDHSTRFCGWQVKEWLDRKQKKQWEELQEETA